VPDRSVGASIRRRYRAKKEAVLDHVAVRPRQADRLVAALVRVDKVDDAQTVLHWRREQDDDLLHVTLPTSTPQAGRGGPGGFYMRRLHDSDQVVRTVREEGWAGFERPLPELFAAAVHAFPGVVADVGANTGFYALTAAALGRRVHAFEPFAPVRGMLEENVRLSCLGGRVRVLPHAVAAESGRATLYVPTQEHGLVETSCSLGESFKPAHSTSIEVSVTSLSDWFRRARVAVIKIDAEGFDHEVLRGGVQLLRRTRALVFLELLPHLGTATMVEGIRRELDYVGARLHADRLVVDASVEPDDEAWNHVLVPRERF
jgi:FkbM family methyltransferase